MFLPSSPDRSFSSEFCVSCSTWSYISHASTVGDSLGTCCNCFSETCATKVEEFIGACGTSFCTTCAIKVEIFVGTFYCDLYIDIIVRLEQL